MSSNSTSRGPTVVAASIIFTVLAAVSVATRFLARVVLLKNAGRDELAILGSLVRYYKKPSTILGRELICL